MVRASSWDNLLVKENVERSDSERVDLVDENDRVIGRATKGEAHEKGLWHRTVHVLVFNSAGELLIAKRAKNRKYAPSALDASVGEHVQAGESYESAATRGLKEELGLDGIRPHKLTFFSFASKVKHICAVFAAEVGTNEFKIPPEETEWVRFFSLGRLEQMIREGVRFTPDFLCSLDYLFTHGWEPLQGQQTQQ